MNAPLRVGIVGLSARDGWAGRSHVPALRLLDGFQLAGVCASSPESTRESAERYQVPLAFDTVDQLAQSGEIDLAVVAVKVPRHAEILAPLLAARVPVLCEWPLAPTSDDALGLSVAASAQDVRSFIGLQARSSPQVRFVRDLVANGAIGEVLSTTLIGSGGAWGNSTPARSTYLHDVRNGATLLSIPFAHAVDALTSCLGQFTELMASMSTRVSRVLVEGSVDTVTRTAPDQLVVQGTLESGVVASVHYQGGRSVDSPLLWKITGTAGELRITGNSGHLQNARLTVAGALDGARELRDLLLPQPYESGDLAGATDAAYAVGHAYLRLRDDLESGSDLVPDFAHAVMLHQLLDDVRHSAENGVRVVRRLEPHGAA